MFQEARVTLRCICFKWGGTQPSPQPAVAEVHGLLALVPHFGALR